MQYTKKYCFGFLFLFFLTENLLLISTSRLPKTRNPVSTVDRSSLSLIGTQNSFLSLCMPCSMCKKKHTAFTNIDNNFLRDCGMRRVPRCRQKRDDPSIYCDSLLAALTLSIQRDLRYYATNSIGNSTLPLRDFAINFSGHRCQLSRYASRLKPPTQLFAIFFSLLRTKIFYGLYYTLSEKRKDILWLTSSIIPFSGEDENASHSS